MFKLSAQKRILVSLSSSAQLRAEDPVALVRRYQKNVSYSELQEMAQGGPASGMGTAWERRVSVVFCLLLARFFVKPSSKMLTTPQTNRIRPTCLLKWWEPKFIPFESQTERWHTQTKKWFLITHGIAKVFVFGVPK